MNQLIKCTCGQTILFPELIKCEHCFCIDREVSDIGKYIKHLECCMCQSRKRI